MERELEAIQLTVDIKRKSMEGDMGAEEQGGNWERNNRETRKGDEKVLGCVGGKFSSPAVDHPHQAVSTCAPALSPHTHTLHHYTRLMCGGDTITPYTSHHSSKSMVELSEGIVMKLLNAIHRLNFVQGCYETDDYPVSHLRSPGLHPSGSSYVFVHTHHSAA